MSVLPESPSRIVRPGQYPPAVTVCGGEDFPVPELLAKRLACRPERRDWVARLPGFVAEIAQRWSLDLGAPFQPGGQCAWVAPARTASGARLVLKIGWVHPEAMREADG